MKKSELDRMIVEEILGDGYDDDEVHMSWYYFVQSEMDFPFQAELQLHRQNAKPIVKEVSVIGLTADEDLDKFFDFKLDVVVDGLIFEIPLKKLKVEQTTDRNLQIIEAWEHWR